MSWRYSSKGLIEPEQVVPAFITLAPMDDESLVGLFSRTFERTVFTNFSKALARAGVATNRPDFVAGADLSDVQIDALARRLGTDVGEISRRLHRPAHGGRHDLRGVDFHGQFLRLTYLARQERRASPRALLQSPHHRALWDLRPLSFDMDTMEMLLDACPVCGTRLGWRNLFGPAKCDRCVDDRGLPSTDLRDFPQPLVDEEYHRGARIAAGLMHPLPEIRTKSLAAFPAPWHEIPPGELFHLMVEMAAMATDRRLHATLMHIAVEPLVDACSVLLHGNEAMHEWAANFADKDPHWTVDRLVALEAYDRLVQCRYISPKTVEVLRTFRRDGQGAHRRKRIGNFDWLVAKDLDPQFGIGTKRARYFVNRVKAHARAGDDLAELGLPTSREELTALVPLVRDAVSLNQAAGILGVGADVAAGLANIDLLPALPPAVRKFFRSERGYSRAKCEHLRAAFWARVAPTAKAINYPTLQQLLKDSRVRPSPRVAAWQLIWSGQVRAARIARDCTDWLKDVHIVDPDVFFDLVSHHSLAGRRLSDASLELVTTAIAAELIQSDIAVVGQLAREEILVPASTRPRMFRRADVDAFAEEFVAAAELRRAMRLQPKGKLPHIPGLPECVFEFAGQRNRFYRRSECAHLLDP